MKLQFLINRYSNLTKRQIKQQQTLIPCSFLNNAVILSVFKNTGIKRPVYCQPAVHRGPLDGCLQSELKHR